MDSVLITLIVLSAAILILSVWVFLLERRIAKLLKGEKGASLEDVIVGNKKLIEDLFTFKDATEKEFARMDARIKRKINGAKTLRFNPFQGTGSGGNQSFAAAFVDETGDGVVLSSLYSRDKVSIFAKPIKNRTSEFELTDEEREVLK